MITGALLAQVISTVPAEAPPAPEAPAAREALPAPEAAAARAGAPPEGAAPPPAEGARSQVQAQGHAYYGYHPVPDGHGTFCIETREHRHAFTPFDLQLFVRVGRAWVFVGDPYDFGYSGGAHVYWHHHPSPWGGWCYHDAGHYHIYGPWGAHFRPHGAYYVYSGAWGPDYYAHHHARSYYYNNVYVPRYKRVNRARQRLPKPRPFGVRKPKATGVSKGKRFKRRTYRRRKDVD